MISKNLNKKYKSFLLQGQGVDELFWDMIGKRSRHKSKEKIRDKIFKWLYNINNKDFPYFNLLHKDFIYASKNINNFLSENMVEFFKIRILSTNTYNSDKEEKIKQSK